jgi:hypothetical protein
MNEQPIAPGPGTEKMGFFARFFAVFFSPGRLLQHLAQRPSWFWMVGLTGLLGGALNFLVFSTEAGQKAFRQQVLESGRTIPPEALEQTVVITRYVGSIAAVVITPIVCLVLAGIVYLIFNVIMGGEGTFRQALAIGGHIFPIGILQGVLRSVLILQKESFQATTSLAAFAPFLDPDSAFLLLLKGIDPFWIWQIGLLALGMSVIHRLPVRKCAVVLFSIYAVVLVAVVLISRLFV